MSSDKCFFNYWKNLLTLAFDYLKVDGKHSSCLWKHEFDLYWLVYDLLWCCIFGWNDGVCLASKTTRNLLISKDKFLNELCLIHFACFFGWKVIYPTRNQYKCSPALIVRERIGSVVVLCTDGLYCVIWVFLDYGYVFLTNWYMEWRKCELPKYKFKWRYDRRSGKAI